MTLYYKAVRLHNHPTAEGAPAVNDDAPTERRTYPLTAEQFAAGCEYAELPICESERGDCAFAYGHIDPEAFANMLDRIYADHLYDSFDAELSDDEKTDPASVRHTWAVNVSDRPNGDWYIYSGDEYK